MSEPNEDLKMIGELQTRLRDIEILARSLNKKCDVFPGHIELKLEIHKILELCNQEPTHKADIIRIVNQTVAAHFGDDYKQDDKIAFQNDLIDRMTEFVDETVGEVMNDG